MILITGGMGFIGLHTARRLLDAGESVVLTQFRTRREPAFLAGELGARAIVEQLDVRDADAMLDLVRRLDVSGIVHLAVPGLGALTPAEEYRVNMDGLLAVLEAARLGGVRRVLLASSVAVYASLPAGPFREEAELPVRSASSTEAYKKAFEVLGLHYANQTGLDLVVARIGGIFGPLYHSMANLPSRLCHAAVRGTEPDLAGARGGVPYDDDVNDLCYVKDCARGMQLLQTAERLTHRIYNLGGGHGVTNRELVAAIAAAVPGFEVRLLPGSRPQARSAPVMELARIRADTGYEPVYDIRSAVADYVAWLRHHSQ